MTRREELLAAAADLVVAVGFARRRGSDWDWDDLDATTVAEAGPWALELYTPRTKELKALWPAFEELVELRVRDARKISPKLLPDVLGLDQLEVLELVYGQLHKLETVRFPAGLQRLSLNSGRSHPGLLDALAALPALSSLDLAYLELEAPGELGRLPALAELCVRGWRAVPGGLASAESLTTLDAWGVPNLDVAGLSGLALTRLETTADHAGAALATFPLRALAFASPAPPSAALLKALAGSTLRELTMTKFVCDADAMAVFSSMGLERLWISQLTRAAMARLIESPSPLEAITLGLLDDRTSPEDLALAILRRPGVRSLRLGSWRLTPACAHATADHPELTYLEAGVDEAAHGALVEVGWRPRRGGLWYVRGATS